MASGDIVQVSPDPTIPTIYRASALGGCTNALLAARMGYEKVIGSGTTPQIFAEGNLHEGDVIQRLRADGWQVSDGQLEVDLTALYDNVTMLPTTIVRGHIDGICYRYPDGKFVLEIKSMGRDSFDQFERLQWDTPGLVQKYKWQISVYMLALNLPGLLVAKNRDNGKLLYSPVPTPFYSPDEIRSRISLIESFAAAGTLQDKCDEFNRYCPYPYLHTADSAYELLDDRELVRVGEKYVSAKVQHQELDRTIKTLRNTIVEALEVKSPGTYSFGGVRVVKSEKGGCRVYLEGEEPGGIDLTF